MTPSDDAEPVSSTAEATPVPSLGVYVRTFGGLVVLTLASYGLSRVSLGAFGTPVALGIAATKVTLVALFFMGLVDEPPSHRLAAVVAVFFVVLIVALSAADILTRT
jgi:cytochrome c oxidase subunit 4